MWGDILLILLISIIFFAIIFFLPLKIEINYNKTQDIDLFEIKVFIIYFIPVYILKRNNFSGNIENKLSKKLFSNQKKNLITGDKINRAKKILQYIKINCRKIVWKTEIGLEDAALTAIISGVLWSLKGAFLSYIKEKYCGTGEYCIKVNPRFSEYHINIKFSGIFLFTLGNIIFTGLRMLKEEVFNAR